MPITSLKISYWSIPVLAKGRVNGMSRSLGLAVLIPFLSSDPAAAISGPSPRVPSREAPDDGIGKPQQHHQRGIQRRRGLLKSLSRLVRRRGVFRQLLAFGGVHRCNHRAQRIHPPATSPVAISPSPSSISPALASATSRSTIASFARETVRSEAISPFVSALLPGRASSRSNVP